MISLPINSNKSQSSGNIANTPQENIAADSLAMNALPADPFAFLLAQQIGKTDLSAPDAAQAAIALDGNMASTGPALNDTQDPAAAVAANAPVDPTNTLAAILQQFPALEDRGQKTEDRQATPFFTLSPSRRVEDRQATQLLTPGAAQETAYKKPGADAENSQVIQAQAIDSLSSETAKHVELRAGPAQAGTNTGQAIPSSAISAAMPNVPVNNMNMPASASQTIATPLGNNGWADEFSQKINWIGTQRNQVAELHLNPPNLGPLEVVLKISDNQATALFASPHGAVRDAVENALPKLREILADNGIMLGNTTISDQSPRDRSMDEFMNQNFGAAAQHESGGNASEPAGSSPAAAQTIPVRRHNGMVDTFA